MYGFKFHQAEGDYARMALWLGEGESKIPIFASHHAGVAGVVAREGQLLVVKEKHKQLGWKFPGGYVNLGEELDVAAMREVLEETGIKTRYSGLLGFRHSHNILYGRGDLYFICKLEALSHEIVVDDEVEDAQWMDIKEFRAQNKNPLLKEIVDMIEFQSPPMEEQRLNSIMSTRKPFLFYSMSQTNKPK